jgi:polysaccharide pyruvyl transferase WcaK-like protein
LKIGILNAYDARNRGDQAIVLCQIELLRRKFQNAEFLVFSRHAVTNAHVLDGPSIQSVEAPLHIPPDGAAMSRLLHPVWDLLCWWLGAKWGKFGKFHECDLFALCGGGYLYSSQSSLISRNLACICLEILFAVGTGKPIFQFPQSFGPITKFIDRWLVLKACAALPHLTPRTKVGYDQLKKWGFSRKAVIVPDTVLSMRQLLPNFYRKVPVRNGLGVIPVDYTFAMTLSGREHKKYINDLAEVCRYFHQRTGENISLFTQVCLPGDDDSVVVDELAVELVKMGIPFHKIPVKLDLSGYVSALGDMRVVIGARMHGCIFALTARVPVIGLAYQPKFLGLFQLMKLESWVSPLDDWSVGWASRRLDDALDPHKEPTPIIEAQIAVLENQLSEYMNKILPNDCPGSGTIRSIAGPARTAPASALRFSIITPSFRNSEWLKLCIASVADQRDAEFEHIVQDSCSDDGTQDWLPQDPRVKAFIEKDTGMYDAVNRGYRRATGDILAYLNCDEQYLPGALKTVREFFEANPEVEVALAGTVIVDANGEYICHRHSLVPHPQGIWFRFPLLTSAVFIRRKVIRERGIFFDTRWRDLGDLHWIRALIEQRVPMKVCNMFTSVFADTGENMMLKPNAQRERAETRQMIPPRVQLLKQFWVAHHRLRRLAAGHFSMQSTNYALYTKNSPEKRITIDVPKPTAVWWNRL